MVKNSAKRSNKVRKIKRSSKRTLQKIPEKLQALLSQALQNHQLGLLDQAIISYRQILALKPSYADANHLLGVALHQRGELEEAVSSIKRAIKRVPDKPSFHSNLGNVLKDLELWDDAISSYRKALALDPQYINAQINIGNALNQLGRYDESGPYLQRSIELKPDSSEAHNNLGLMYHEGYDFLDEAEESFVKALSLAPDYMEAHYNLGNLYNAQGRLDEALSSYRHALRINSNHAKAYGNIGNVFKKQNRFNDAIVSYETALSLDPTFVEMHYNIGLIYLSNGQIDEAFNCLRRAAKSCPENGLMWATWADSIVSYKFERFDENLLGDLRELLNHRMVSTSRLASPILRALAHVQEFSGAMNLISKSSDINSVIYKELAGDLSKIPLLIELMGLSPIDDTDVERMLTNLRRIMILQLPDDDLHSLPFSAALALHCFTNEYIFTSTEKEKEAVSSLELRIVKMLENNLPVPPLWIVALGAYRALHEYAWADKLLTLSWPDTIVSVLNHQVKNPKEERALEARISSFNSITDSVSKAVREQYEANPYPRWIKIGLPQKGKSIAQVLRDIQLPIIPETRNIQKNPDVLIAGCGTGQQSITSALRFANSKVTALDLSLKSLAYAVRKAQELDLPQIDHIQGDIMELPNLQRQFDIIECTGVLHHLEDPIAGWRILLNHLRRDGLLKIGLYSKIARRSITKAQLLIKENSYSSTVEDIRKCRHKLISSSKEENSEFSEILKSSDFYSVSGCRDLLFHVQEHQFTIPQIEEILQGLCLDFLGFEIADQTIIRKFRTTFPQYEMLASLNSWHQFETDNPSTFAGMYQFWCRKRVKESA